MFFVVVIIGLENRYVLITWNVIFRVPGDTKDIITNKIKAISLETKKLKSMKISSTTHLRFLEPAPTAAPPAAEKRKMPSPDNQPAPTKKTPLFSLNSEVRSVTSELPDGSRTLIQVCRIAPLRPPLSIFWKELWSTSNIRQKFQSK